MVYFPGEFSYTAICKDFIYVYSAEFHKGFEMILSDLLGNF
jgi:hypothetical protein